MRIYESGYAFEEAVFGSRSSGAPPKYGATPVNFDQAIRSLIGENGQQQHPDTNLGASIYRAVVRGFEKFQLNPSGLVFVSAIGTNADEDHGVDGFFFSPDFPRHPVTVDAFSILGSQLDSLREYWVDSFEGIFYSDRQFQLDLHAHKSGRTTFFKEGHKTGLFQPLFGGEPDFRRWSRYPRPENHFILTPLHAGSYEKRRMFGWMIAQYFAGIVPFCSCHKTAL